MRTDWSGTYGKDTKRDTSFLCFPTISWSEFVLGRRIPGVWDQLSYYNPGDVVVYEGNRYRCTARVIIVNPVAGDAFWELLAGDEGLADPLPDPDDYTDATTDLVQTSKQLTFSIDVPTFDATVPKPGEIVAVRDNTTGQWLFAGQVESHDAKLDTRGARYCSGVARTRADGARWKGDRWTSPVYPVGTELAIPVIDILRSLGLVAEEYPSVQPMGRWTPHTTTQLGDMTAWEMLSTLLFPVLQVPFIDAVGRFKPISRDVRREPDLEIPEDQVLSIRGSQAGAPPTAVVLKWLDYRLSESVQQDQALGQGNVTAGYFSLRQHVRIYWSKDRKQRAKNTRMKVLQSANQKFDFCEESYAQIDDYHGRVTVVTDEAIPAGIITAIVQIAASVAIPDEVTAFGFIANAGFTIRIGTLISDLGLLELAGLMKLIGTGTYEAWGQPFDYINAVNTTEAYIRSARAQERREVPLESDIILDEAHAQEVAVAELVYRHCEPSKWPVEIVDYPAIEPGDILRLAGTTRIYVEDFSRNLRRGAPATLSVDGFRV